MSFLTASQSSQNTGTRGSTFRALADAAIASASLVTIDGSPLDENSEPYKRGIAGSKVLAGLPAIVAGLAAGFEYTDGVTHVETTTETGKTYPANVVAGHVHRLVLARVAKTDPTLAATLAPKNRGAHGFIVAR